MITTQPAWQVIAGGTLVGFFTDLPTAEASAASFATLTSDSYLFEVVNYIYSEDSE